jgi:sugar phosphate isomerase/epimerase
MSAAPSPNVERTIERCRTEDVTPISIDAGTLESTAPGYLRDLKRELAAEDYSPSTLVVRARFDSDCSLATQEEADRIRSHVRAASFLGATGVTVTCDSVPDPEKVRPALAACAERAHREGLAFELDAPITLDDD